MNPNFNSLGSESEAQEAHTLGFIYSRPLFADSLPLCVGITGYYHNVTLLACFFAPAGMHGGDACP